VILLLFVFSNNLSIHISCFQLQKHLCAENHPYHKFSTGWYLNNVFFPNLHAINVIEDKLLSWYRLLHIFEKYVSSLLHLWALHDPLISGFCLCPKTWNATTKAPSGCAFLAVLMEFNSNIIMILYFENNCMTNFALHGQQLPLILVIFHGTCKSITKWCGVHLMQPS
jgi:hypothetical protein